MCSLGKLVDRQVENPVQPAGFVPISVPASFPEEQEVCCSSLLFLRDILLDRDFRINSGASVFVFPGPAYTSSDGVRLLTADGTQIHCSGTRIIPLRFSCGSDSKVYSWNFHLAPVSVPLLGADFLQYFDLLVNVKGCQLVHAQCPEDVVIHASPNPVRRLVPLRPSVYPEVPLRVPRRPLFRRLHCLPTLPWCPPSSAHQPWSSSLC